MGAQSTYDEKKLLNLKEAAKWASQYLKKLVTVSNISYLIQYGRIAKYGINGNLMIELDELKEYYDKNIKNQQDMKKTDNELDWHLSFSEYRESERTKHVHRLHPYKGKFIPQLVEYFLDSHTDEFKKDIYFQKNDIILDPFCGSGTTLVQANELGMNGIGIDVSSFNAMISNAKVEKHDLNILKREIDTITLKLKKYQNDKNNVNFENHILFELSKFNKKNFPSPEFKRKVRSGDIDEKQFSKEKEDEFLTIYNNLVSEYKIKIEQSKESDSFLNKWFTAPVRDEIDFVFNEITNLRNSDTKKVLAIILSRTVRSCRATTHADLGTLKEPVTTTYYCKKHGKICKPIFTIINWWQRYTIDTLNRLKEFEKLRTSTHQVCLTGDSRTIEIKDKITSKNIELAKILERDNIKGIFSSPPYVGLINYHEQHAYAYEIFSFERKDEFEIGPLYNGQGKKARDSYVKGVSQVLLNCKKYLVNDYDIFLVANDKYNLYPMIAKLAGMKIVNKFKRPVLNRVEKDRSHAYSEIVFHLKEL